MTRSNRQGPGRRTSHINLTDDEKRELETGMSYDNPFCGDVDLLAAAWESHRGKLLPAWIKQRPGTRPYAWWVCEGVPQFGERRVTAEWSREHEQHRENWSRWGILHTNTVPPLQEPQRAYLERNQLLTPLEMRDV